MMLRLFVLLFTLAFLSCSTTKKIRGASKTIIDFSKDSIFAGAHIGISVYDPGTNQYVFDHDGEKYFTPASNTKIITCYEAMHNLKDSLAGIRYYEDDTAIYLIPTGDPTLLHPDYLTQPVINLLQKTNKKIYITDQNWKDNDLGMGWSWDDYNGYYSAERNALPVYGNVISWKQQKVKSNDNGNDLSVSVYSTPEIDWKVRFEAAVEDSSFYVQRDRYANVFHISEGNEDSAEQSVPFIVNGIQSALELLKDTIGKEIALSNRINIKDPSIKTISSQPLDSVLRPMMYRSDNFFAEQLLLMVGENKTGLMNDEKGIDTILKSDLEFLTKKPSWVDGSGLSRFNLFTPHTFIEVLNKMQSEFGMERIKKLFPTGNTGTLKNYYVSDNGRIYAKTGSLTHVMALSGFYYTKKGRLLLFSILVNDYTGSTVKARRRFEEFIHSLDR